MQTNRIYFSRLQIVALGERLLEPAEVSEATGLDYDQCVDRCDAMNSDLNAGSFITTPLLDSERTILAYAARASQLPPPPRSLSNLIAKLRAAGVEITSIPAA